jgi:hypothetical protein
MNRYDLMDEWEVRNRKKRSYPDSSESDNGALARVSQISDTASDVGNAIGSARNAYGSFNSGSGDYQNYPSYNLSGGSYSSGGGVYSPSVSARQSAPQLTGEGYLSKENESASKANMMQASGSMGGSYMQGIAQIGNALNQTHKNVEGTLTTLGVGPYKQKKADQDATERMNNEFMRKLAKSKGIEQDIYAKSLLRKQAQDNALRNLLY